MCQVRESRYSRQNVIEDRPLAIVPWTGCCWRSPTLRDTHIYPSPRVILHSRLNVRLSVHVCSCRWNINELQGGPQNVLDDEGIAKYEEELFDYVAYYTRFIHGVMTWVWGYRDPLLNNDSISFFVFRLCGRILKRQVSISVKRLWKLYSNDAILKFLIRLEFFFFLSLEF